MGYTRTDISSANDAVPVDVSTDNQILPGTCRNLYVGTAGDIALVTAKGSTVTFASVPVGVLPVQATQINNSGTTASGILALY